MVSPPPLVSSSCPRALGGHDPELESSTALPTVANSFPSEPSAATTEAPRDIVINAVGEVTFDSAAVGSVPADALAGIGDTFTTDDLTIVTLTCGVAPPDTLLLSVGPCTAEQMTALAAAGVDVVVLANDGIEPSVVENTVAATTAAGMTPVGAGTSDVAAGPVSSTSEGSGWRSSR